MKYPDQEVSELIRKYILLPFVLTVLERDKKVVEKMLRTPGPYKKWLEQTQQKVHDDLVNVRKLLRSRNIQIYEEGMGDHGVWHKYKYQGYHHQTEFQWPYLRALIEGMLKEYMKA